MTATLVLASTSAARRRLLSDAGVQHQAIAPGVDEESAKTALKAEGVIPRDLADALAELKALAGHRRTGALTLGSDQVLDLDGEALDKGETIDAVRIQLEALRGRRHRLHSAAVLVDNGAPVWRHVSTATLWVRNFSDAFLDAYLAQAGEAVTGSVGGYHVEGLGVQLFERIEGDSFTVQGLPLIPLLQALRDRGVVAA